MTAGGRHGESEAQLALDETDMRLPWLEVADEDGEEGLDWSRIGKFAGIVAAVLFVAAIGVWVLTQWGPGAPEGDGSLIAAPTEPYKVKPENPGGKEFAGTGDTSYQVGEGIEKEARLAQQAPEPEPAAEPEAPAPEPEPALTGVGVQVGAYSTEAAARTGWVTLRQRYEGLKNYDRRIVEGRADIGTVFRLQAVAPTLSGANALCTDLKANGIECQVKR